VEELISGTLAKAAVLHNQAAHRCVHRWKSDPLAPTRKMRGGEKFPPFT
jgi:hypothetical protein